MTLFKSVLSRLGLSQTEAAAFLDVRLDTLKKWSAGTNPAPIGVWMQLAELSDLQENAAVHAAQAWEESGTPDQIEFGLASDDYEAQSLGWPCVGAHRAVAARLWELTGVVVSVVPRGSTPATAAAIDFHG